MFALLWQLPPGRSETWYFWFFLIGSNVFYLAYTVFATPWVALGYELTLDYHERTRLMGVQNFIGQLAYVIAPWFLLIIQSEMLFDGMVDGAAGLAILIAVVVMAIGILPAIFLKERFKDLAVAEAHAGHRKPAYAGIASSISDFMRGCGITLRSRPFMKLCAATFLVFNQWNKNGTNLEQQKRITMARIIPRKDKRKTTFTVTVRIKGYDSVSRTFDTKGGPRAWALEVKAEMKGA